MDPSLPPPPNPCPLNSFTPGFFPFTITPPPPPPAPPSASPASPAERLKFSKAIIFKSKLDPRPPAVPATTPSCPTCPSPPFVPPFPPPPNFWPVNSQNLQLA